MMMRSLTIGLLWFSAIGCGLLAGVYFAFSAFVMTALGRIDQMRGVAAMKEINSVILKSPFMPIFLATTLTGLALAILGIVRWGAPSAVPMLAGGAIYVLGMFVVTMLFNVPLNNAIAAVDPASAEAAGVWARYLHDWVFWNHVRTVASTAAFALFIFAISAR